MVVLDLHDLDFPADWREIFGREAPLDLEIGFGNGEFLIALARRHPERNYLGVEISGESLKKAARKVEKAGLSHVRLLLLDARLALLLLIPPETLENVYINFPDPWPKKRHAKRRMLSAEFLRLLASRMKPGGKLWVATDDPAFRDFVLENLREVGESFRSDHPGGYTLQRPDLPPSKYERKWAGMGKPIYYLRLTRTEHPVPHPAPPFRRDWIMPHVVLTRPDRPLQALLEDLPLSEERLGERGVLKLKRVFITPQGDEALIEVFVEEEGLGQHLLLLVGLREKDLIVKVSPFTRPIVTPGVKTAVARVADFLKSRGLEEVRRNF